MFVFFFTYTFNMFKVKHFSCQMKPQTAMRHQHYHHKPMSRLLLIRQCSVHFKAFYMIIQMLDTQDNSTYRLKNINIISFRQL